MSVGWVELAEELEETLMRLRDGDGITLRSGDVWVQFVRYAGGNGRSGLHVHTTAPAADLTEQGWELVDGGPTVALPPLVMPFGVSDAQAVAAVVVETLRDDHGVADPAALTYSSFNENGQRALLLRTVAPGEGMERPARDPATVLPPPSPRWQRWCEVLAGGLGDWSVAELERLAAAQGWEPREEHRFGESVVGHTYDAGSYGHGEISSLSVKPAADRTDFREALAGAVAALGHPPLVGGTGFVVFARWRGTAATVTLLARDDDRPQLKVEPTRAREALIYNHQKWMMTPDDWAPDELWFTHPDVGDPSFEALNGMMSYPHSRSETLKETLDELSSLFHSWGWALPLLDPYASSACWKLRRPDGFMIAEGEFTAHRVSARFGRRDEYGEPVSADPGVDSARLLVERVRAALALAGVTAPDELRADAWSRTRAEKLHAIRLTLRSH